MNISKQIETHSGPFHGDDVMAILKLHPDYRDGYREKETLDWWYDHHKKGFHLTMDQLSDGEINTKKDGGGETKLSSAGLSESDWRAKEALEEQVLRRREKHKSGCVLILDKNIRWAGIIGEVLKDIEKKYQINLISNIKYVISKIDEGSVRSPFTVTVLPGHFLFPKSWRGLPDLELQRALWGLPDQELKRALRKSGCLVSSAIYGVPYSGHKAFTDTMEDALAIVDFMLERSFTGTKK